MKFNSILFIKPEDSEIEDTLEAPSFFIDLNLNQIVDTLTARKQEYNLKPFFYSPLHDVETIKYRQDVFHDIENEELFTSIKSFAQEMSVMHRYLNMIKKLSYKYHIEGWFLEAVIVYCNAVDCLVRDLSTVNIKSSALKNFQSYINDYAGSSEYKTLRAETEKLKTDLLSIRYALILRDNWVRVRKYESETDYSIEIEQVFEKFKQGSVKNYSVNLTIAAGMNHVEAQIIDLVAKLFPEIFLELDNYYIKNNDFLDKTISIFEREIQFYISYLEYIADIKHAGYKFCYPKVSDHEKEEYDYEGFDLALTRKSIFENIPVICNDYYLKGKERIIIVSGPNQGGKTTFARMYGQLHYLASLGCPIPGTDAQLFLFDKLFTHFEREEDIRSLRGKLQDDLLRIHNILDQVTSNSIVIMNEIFTSTALKDALFLSKEIMEKILQLDLLCVCVTFIEELASLSEQTISMVSTIVPENPTLRTFKIVRKPADGLAYAICIAEKYGLTYANIKERIKE